MTRANIASFKAKTVALIDTLHLTSEEVVGLAMTLAVSYGDSLSRLQLHAALDANLQQARNRSADQQTVLAHMAQTARAAKGQGLDSNRVLHSTYPDAPEEVIASVWWQVEEEVTATWWDRVASTIDAGDANAVAAVEGDNGGGHAD